MRARRASSNVSSANTGKLDTLEQPIIGEPSDVEDGGSSSLKPLENKGENRTWWSRLWQGGWKVPVGPDGYKPFWYEATLCCTFTFFLAFKPSEPHLTTYLRETKGFTDDQINSQIYPWSTYACIPFLLIGGLLSEFIGYKFMLILGAMGRLTTRILLLFGTTVFEMQIMQCTYAFGTAAEKIFYGYLFHIVPSEKYQKLTSINLAAYVLSHMLSGIIGDVMLNAGHMSYTSLQWFSAVSVLVATVTTFFLTSVNRDKAPRPKEVWKTMKWAYEDKVYVLILFWWIFGNCAYGLIDGYEMSLYDMMMVEEGTEENYNGTVYAIAQLIATISALSVAVPWIFKIAYTHQHLTVGSLGLWCILALTLMVWYPRILPMCIGFILYYLGYHFINAFVSAETGRVVNKHMKEEDNVNSGCYAIIVMFNNLTAYILSTILSLIMFTWFQIDLRTVYKILWTFQLSFQTVFMSLAVLLFFLSKRLLHPVM
ncbi:conserved hypothetical protein [Perkinsus marinus ATCC 50983]|uniref:Uncharacterized protein n=1 Tax=Perkinsus marinus (strain ATCC 50983 / TXsc) TaxID=423536 RepID=C5L154_PERM5|nr:conserved hypothetical protein [Perkinsus marinus ATCC 50983]EER09538.1 conserved hypothetical protein [Perkinsus marinus ATCC 50983]|eukprot:XP_002777743.1 conserved hypothetical protein [Perkinsus marinus ATCC 50983]